MKKLMQRLRQTVLQVTGVLFLLAGVWQGAGAISVIVCALGLLELAEQWGLLA